MNVGWLWTWGAIASQTRHSTRSDLAIREFAAAQHGVLTLAQLEALGLGRRAVAQRVEAGRLTRVHRGVYAPGRPTREGCWMAAVLVCGEGALLSHQSAAALWGMRDVEPSPTHVTATGNTRRSRVGLTVHSGATLATEDVNERCGIPCTSVARTLVDLAAVVGGRSLERAVDRAEELRAFDLTELEDALTRSRHRRGVARMRRVLGQYSGATVTQSEAEERLLAVLTGSALPKPDLNAWISVGGGEAYRADFLWRAAGLVVEVDGRTFHAKRRSFRRDRQRDRHLALVGYETRRYAADEVFENPAAVVAEIREFLSGRPQRLELGVEFGRQ